LSATPDRRGVSRRCATHSRATWFCSIHRRFITSARGPPTFRVGTALLRNLAVGLTLEIGHTAARIAGRYDSAPATLLDLQPNGGVS
jgi:hypothetical protein